MIGALQGRAMANRWEDACAEHVRARGAPGLWDLALLAAVWPYMLHPGVQAWVVSGLKTSPYIVALSLAVTFLLIAGLRSAIVVLHSAVGGGHEPRAKTDGAKTLPGAVTHQARGFYTREAFRSLTENLDRSLDAGLLGVLRFANYSSMEAYDAAAAESVLSSFAGRLEASVGNRRPVTQVDSHTFAIWIASAEDEADRELRSIAYVLAQEINHERLTVAPDVYVGRAAFPRDGDSMIGLMSHAEAVLAPLKRLKELNRANAVFPKEDVGERFAMEQALRHAVRENQLSLRYQPFVDISAGVIAGAEALLRWRHPVFGDVPPTRFVPLLEETGLIDEIGLWTLNTACRQLCAWRAMGQAPFRLAVNLSAVQLQNNAVQAMIARTVASHGLSPADIELELTETAAMEDQSRTFEVFSQLREQGFGIAIDDFGSGHSNLGYLKNLPFTKLKIDREFVSHVDTQTGSKAICKALLELSSGLGISVLAEGVERVEEVETLRSLGCTTFQGYYFARPLLAEDFASLADNPEWRALISSSIHRSREELKRRMSA